MQLQLKCNQFDPFIKIERQIATFDFALQRDFSNFSFCDETNSDFCDLYLGWSIIIHIANLILGLGFSWFGKKVQDTTITLNIRLL